MTDTNNTPAATTKPAFLPQHVRYLADRGIPIEYALEAGIESFDLPSDLITKSLKRRFKNLAVYPSSGLLTPYLVQPLDGIRRARVRWDMSKYYIGTPGADERSVDIPRYTAQEGVPVIPYYPPKLLVEGIADNPAVDLYIVEAPMKALSMTANGFSAIGLGGVEAGFHDAAEWKTSKHLTINKELDRVLWRGRRVYITYDAGITNNPRVSLGAAKLAHVLHARGADVRFVILPLVHVQERSLDDLMSFGDDDQGPDDFLARHGKGALQQLIDGAVAANPIARVEAVMNSDDAKDAKSASVTELLSDLTFVAALHVEGRIAIDRVAAVIKPTGIKARAIHDQVSKLLRRLETGNADKAEAADLPYLVEQGRLAMTTFMQGVPNTRYLTDFTATITEEIIADDGVETTRVMKIDGNLPDGKPLPTLEVPASEFPKLDWASTWGSKAIIRAGRDTRDHTRVAIQHLSKPTEATVYTHLGWREIDGQHVYLHPGGAVGAGSTKVRVSVQLERGRYGFPEQTENVQAAVRASLSILDAGSLDITLPALASAYTAVLAEILELDFAVWFVGQSGSLKSTLVSKTMGHFGSFDYHSLPMTWNATAGAIEVMLFKLKDALTVIDNYVPGATTRDHQQLSGTALRVIQAIGDRAGRGRLDRNSEERATRRPRGLALMTGEDLPPTNESTIGRLVVVDVPKGALHLDKLAAIQDNATLLPHAMRGFIEWLAPRIKTETARVRQLRSLTAASYRAQLVGVRVHERTPNSLAALAVGFSMFLDFAMEVGVLDADRCDYLHAKADEELLRIARKQVANVEGVKPHERYLSSLRALLLQGRVALANRDQDLTYVTLPTCKGIGWLDGEHVYFVQELAWNAVEEFNAREGWPYRKTQLHKQLADLGIIEREDGGEDGETRLTCRRTLGGASRRVLAIHKRHLEDAVADPEQAKKLREVEEARREVEMYGNGLAVEEYGVN